MKELKYCYAVKHKNEDVRAMSRSGGIFTAVSDAILSKNGVVYGCIMSDDFTKAYHARAVTTEERDKMRGSKYVQSNVGNCYNICADDLKNGKTVLFTGTPCQIEALNCFLAQKNVFTEKLITMDIICHSVNSVKVWNKFLDWKSAGKSVNAVDFRDKVQFGWKAHKETVVLDGKAESSDIYTKIYYRNVAYPRHCFKCYFKSTDRISDITIGDYWGIDELDSKFNDDKGVSLVIPNTSKGMKYIEDCSENLTFKKFLLADSIQPPLDHNYHIPERREQFFKDLDKMDFGELSQKYINPQKTFSSKIIESAVRLFKR